MLSKVLDFLYRHKTLINLWFFAVIVLVLGIVLTGCGTTESKPKVGGYRWEARLVRADDEQTWTEVQGKRSYLLFGAGAFREVAESYVEPQFYGPTQGCVTNIGGTYSATETQTDKYDLTLVYDPGGPASSTGLCRQTNRTLKVVLQPSGALDVFEEKRVVRFDRKEKLN